MSMQVIIMNLGATKTLHQDNINGAETALAAWTKGRAVPVPLKSKASCVFVAAPGDFFLSEASPAGLSEALWFPKAQKQLICLG